ncbi:MAG: hypothetical protein MR941_03240 [[Ruminococcus] gnavus]|nr:hypothetical protein [Mediterraneibacter gnavus]
MDNKNTEVNFKYTYSAKEQEEIKIIRQKYQAPEENGMERLRKLDAKVGQKATSLSLIVGVLGALIMGFGMSLVMTDLGTALRMHALVSMMIGIVTGILGIVLVALAYPTYKNVMKKEREKAAPEILKLTEELLK